MVTVCPVCSVTGSGPSGGQCGSSGLAGPAECRCVRPVPPPLSQPLNHARMVFVGAVGEVQPGHVHAQRSISSRIISSELLAGPMVQTILARRRRGALGRQRGWVAAPRCLTLSDVCDPLRLGTEFGMRSEEESRIAQSIELGADQHHHRDDVQPDQQRDGRGDRAVNDVVVGEVAQIEAEHQRWRRTTAPWPAPRPAARDARAACAARRDGR